MKYLPYLCLILLGASTTVQAAFDDELEAPDVDFYVELHGTQSDLDNLNGDDTGGLRIRLGMDVRSIDLGPWLFRVEGSFNAFGESSSSSEQRQGPLGNESVIRTRQQVRLNGLELGGRFLYGRYLSLRAGGFIYASRDRRRFARADNLAPGEIPAESDFIDDPIAAESTDSSVAPYIGIVGELPLGRKWRLLAEYDLYIIEGETVTTASGGLQYRF